MNRIVVGVDGSEGAAQALRWAARESELRQWSLEAVMAWAWLEQHPVFVEEQFDSGYDEGDARRALDAYVEAALDPAAAAKVERRMACDLAPRALLDAALDAELVVVGARGLGEFQSLLLGSVSQQCLHHAPCPIAVVHPGESPAATLEAERADTTAERIVVGIDGSEAALQALRWAVDEARCRQATLMAVYAWQLPYLVGLPYTGVSFDPSGIEGDARRILDAAVDSVDTTGLAEPVERVVDCGGAASVILAAAKGADLVVVGSRGLGGFRGLLLGSVAHRVVHHADCPVVVLPQPG